ncbi:AbgT family transporter [Flammeovirga pacifica]|uniref:Aminobenzoyl-glutamate transporter n=1 Tax=Flammeovirga pacifica TaxID=915059 RepID=A0A1S1YWJ2_FLAPC|nr:AbgT family transporter [Flammeovirga pacifica]OHX65382.1 aminobenzoyl-glutamate transporter [Flammeovirga pacifica]
MNESNNSVKKNPIDKFLSFIEKVGNALPHPATLFAGFAFAVIILSWIFSLIGLSVKHPGKDEMITVVNLLSQDGMYLILTKLVKNFTDFAPLGVVLVAMLGIGIAEGSGLIGTLIRILVLKSPKKIITFVVVFAGVLSNTASEVGYVLLVPLSAVIFLAFGKHPIAGLAAAFAGVSGGYSANLLLGTIDPLLQGISQEAAQIIDGGYQINAACNYYFMFVSTFFIGIAGTFVTEKIVIPRLGEYKGDEVAEKMHDLTKEERKGLIYAGIAALILFTIIMVGIIPESGFLRKSSDPTNIFSSALMKGIVSWIFIIAAVCGIAYGKGSGTFKSDADIMKGMGESMKTMSSYIVLVFFAAQFVAYFKWTNIGLISAIKGAEFLEALGLHEIPLLICFILLAALINLVMGSASAKWTLMAPVFIPMFMLLGISPELTQVAYRIGDSVTNIISPMMSYFALIVAFIQRYDKKAGIGTVIATMLPYSIAFLIVWVVLMAIWLIFDFPIGPNSPLKYIP